MLFQLVKSFDCKSGKGYVVKSGNNYATIYRTHWGEPTFPLELNPENSKLLPEQGDLRTLVPIDHTKQEANWSAWSQVAE